MIKILERYIAKNIIYATLLTMLIILGVLFLMTLLGELKNIGEGDYRLAQAIVYVLMRMPGVIYGFAPMLILLGSIAGLSSLTSSREVTVMRVSGFSVRQIIYSTLCAAFLLTIIIGVIGEEFAPRMNNLAETNKENSRNAGQAVATSAGVWLHVDNSFIHIEHVVNRQLLEGVTRYQFDDKHHLLAAYYAKTLSYEAGNWVMNDAVKTSFFHDRTKSESYKQADWNLKFNINLLNIGLMDPDEMSLPKLAKLAHYLERNGLRASEYQYEFWRRVLQPLASLIMIFLAVPFVLGALRTNTLGLRMVVGIVAGFAFFIANAFLGQLCIVYQLPAVFAAFVPLFIFALLGIYLSKKLITR